MSVRPTVLVLGGTGFIGRALLRRLRHDGLTVRALVRNITGDTEALAHQGVELVKGDYADPHAIEDALEGVQHVFHVARAFGTCWEDYLRREVEPTRHLAEFCSLHGIALYYASSIAIYDGGRAGDVITESTPPSRQAMRINLYARAKVASEQLLTEMQHKRGLKVVVFRPGIVIGTRGSPYHQGVGAWPSSSLCCPWGGGSQRLPFVLVDDCVDAMVKALHRSDIFGESFNLVGDPCLSGNEYLDALELIAGIRIRRLRTPTWWMFARSAAKWGLQALARDPERRLPSYRYIEGLSCRASYKSDLAKRRLEWTPVPDVAKLIERGIAVPVGER
jgi:nucleoside-diphosphate-sugar epimerase